MSNRHTISLVGEEGTDLSPPMEFLLSDCGVSLYCTVHVFDPRFDQAALFTSAGKVGGAQGLIL